MDVIVFDKDEVSFQLAVFAEMNDMLDEAFALVIAGMGFAGKNELERAFLVLHQSDNVLELLKNEGSAFVSGEAARKANGQGIGVQQLIEGDKVSLGEPLSLDQEAAAGEFDQLAAQTITQRPDLFVGNERRIGHFVPEIR